MSLVLQESILFEGTVRDNIALGRPEASDEEIIAAAKQAAIHEVILRLPDGYNTRVREQGNNFSGGQRQRIAIARAILRDAPILILDEPTASLDAEAESEVTHALDSLIVNRTVLLISHRLSTLGNVDEIIVLKDGNIIERGTFQKLKRLGGVFAGFLKEQNRYNLDRVSEPSIVRPADMAWTNGRSAAVNEQEVTILRSIKPAPTPASAQARIMIEVNGKMVEERQLDGDHPVLTIGRLPTNDVMVPSRRVSRLHARLCQKDGAWMIEDLDSLNGLIYQGNRVDQHTLGDGDRITFAPGAVLAYATAS